jgi:hypothetical protein
MLKKSSMKITIYSTFASLLVAGFVLSSCGNKGGSVEMSAADSAALNQSKEKAVKVFFAVPSPLEMANMIKQSGAKFNKSVLNPVANAPRYSSSLTQALNLGIYTADLSYCSSFDQTQESMQYMGTCKKLADALGVTGALSETIINRLEKNVNNKDTLLDLVAEMYATTDSYLRENERASTTAIIVAGGWIEALYISTQIANVSKNNTAIIQRIAEQKDVLNNLVKLLESYPADQEITPVLADMKSIESLYANVTINTEAGEVKHDEATQVTVVDDKSTSSISPEQLAAITKKVSEIRSAYIT